MKKKKLLTTLLEVTAMLICMSMLMALSGCSSNSKGKKKDKKDSKYEDKEDEDEETVVGEMVAGWFRRNGII